MDEYLAEELQAGRIVGPLDPNQLLGAQVSRFGVIPKAGQPNKWRLILDLSSLRDHSVNDGIRIYAHSSIPQLRMQSKRFGAWVEARY